MLPGCRLWFRSVRCLHTLNAVRHRCRDPVGQERNLKQRFAIRACDSKRLAVCYQMSANKSSDVKELATAPSDVADGSDAVGGGGRGSPSPAEPVPDTDKCRVGLESGAERRSDGPSVSREGAGEEDSSAPQNKLSRRAMKRFMRNKQRAAAKEGRTAKRRRKEEAGERELNFTESSLKDGEYYFERGLRKVYPYYFTFSTYAKGRWVGQNILDIFDKEFKAYDRESYQRAINSGTVTVNNRKVDTSFVFKENDYVENTVHRHELGVTGVPIRIVKETERVLVIDKPSSIPVHPCGRYRYNSVTYILAKDYGYRNLRSIYRLDRLTSGLLIFCKTDTQTQMMQDHIKNRKVEKSYIAMVTGRFPSEPRECSEPIDILSQKIGLFKVGPNGKESHTSFELLHTNGKTSVVLCKPHTGRTHQIRIHLQYIGYPIVNDPLYNTHIWGPTRGKGGEYGKDEEQLVEDLIKHHNSERFADDEVTNMPQITTVSTGVSMETDGCEQSTSCQDQAERRDSSSGPLQGPSGGNGTNYADGRNLQTDSSTGDDTPSTDTSGSSAPQSQPAGGTVRAGFDRSKMTTDPLCVECRKRYKDPSSDELVMFLHALSYKGPGWEFSTDMPDWAREDLQQPENS